MSWRGALKQVEIVVIQVVLSALSSLRFPLVTADFPPPNTQIVAFSGRGIPVPPDDFASFVRVP